MHYRRAFAPGGSYFFTLVTEQRRPVFASNDNVSLLREAFRRVRKTRPFDIDAMVVLPEHLHCIWTLPPDDADFATRWRLIKTWFTKHSQPEWRTTPNAARAVKHEQAVWQHRYWEHQLRDAAARRLQHGFDIGKHLPRLIGEARSAELFTGPCDG